MLVCNRNGRPVGKAVSYVARWAGRNAISSPSTLALSAVCLIHEPCNVRHLPAWLASRPKNQTQTANNDTCITARQVIKQQGHRNRRSCGGWWMPPQSPSKVPFQRTLLRAGYFKSGAPRGLSAAHRTTGHACRRRARPEPSMAVPHSHWNAQQPAPNTPAPCLWVREPSSEVLLRVSVSTYVSRELRFISSQLSVPLVVHALYLSTKQRTPLGHRQVLPTGQGRAPSEGHRARSTENLSNSRHHTAHPTLKNNLNAPNGPGGERQRVDW